MCRVSGNLKLQAFGQFSVVEKWVHIGKKKGISPFGEIPSK